LRTRGRGVPAGGDDQRVDGGPSGTHVSVTQTPLDAQRCLRSIGEYWRPRSRIGSVRIREKVRVTWLTTRFQGWGHDRFFCKLNRDSPGRRQAFLRKRAGSRAHVDAQSDSFHGTQRGWRRGRADGPCCAWLCRGYLHFCERQLQSLRIAQSHGLEFVRRLGSGQLPFLQQGGASGIVQHDIQCVSGQ
jgi:hypothetical protein